jgi:uncharacterized protein YigE (DUF2233 family)
LRIVLAVAALIVVAATAIVGWRAYQARRMPEPPVANRPLPTPCRDVTFEGEAFIACAVDARDYRIVVAHKRPDRVPYKSLQALAEAVPFSFAMNAGMYHEDNSAVGPYVENGREDAPLNLSDGEGNFFLKPNGVFFVDKDVKLGLLETGAFAAVKPSVEYASQSGPMLVINGEIHPRFEPDGQSRYIRNGVGIDSQGRAVFAISRSEVSLGKFARLFRDGLDCGSALFFDGAISALHDGKDYIIGGEYPVGPIVAVTRRDDASASQ